MKVSNNKPGKQLLIPSLEESQSEQPRLHSNCKAELEEVSGNVRERHQTSEGRIQLTTHHPSGRQLLNPSPLQTDEDVHIPHLCSPGLQTCPIQNNIEITREQVHSETLGRRNVSGQSGLLEHADRGERVGKGRHHLRGFRCLYSALYSGCT